MRGATGAEGSQSLWTSVVNQNKTARRTESAIERVGERGRIRGKQKNKGRNRGLCACVRSVRESRGKKSIPS